jgi:RND superfamily putative drug exporter
VAVALGVLLDTLVVRSVLVTALNLELRGRMWWPGALAARDALLETATPTGAEEAGEEPAGEGALEPAH